MRVTTCLYLVINFHTVRNQMSYTQFNYKECSLIFCDQLELLIKIIT